MTAVSALVLLLAPIVARQPVGADDWEKERDPVTRRIASLLAGEPIVSGGAAVVPLFARVPSEAGHGKDSGIDWIEDRIQGRILREDGRHYMRVINENERAIFVPAGTVFQGNDGVEVYIARDAIVPGNFAALFPVLTSTPLKEDAADRSFSNRGVLPPVPTGALLHGRVSFRNVALNAWRMHGAGNYGGAQVAPRVRFKRDKLLKRCGALATQMGGTAVGAVFLVGDTPVAVHVFRTHDHFQAALPDLLHGFAVQVGEEEIRQGGNNGLAAHAQSGNVHGRAVALLRNLLRIPGAWSESYGAGFDVIVKSKTHRVVGHAVVDHKRTVVHAGFFVLGRWWPAEVAKGGGAAAGGGGGGPAPPAPRPPRRPDSGDDETPPGVVDRKARPSVAEERRRDRNPNPGPGGGRKGR